MHKHRIAALMSVTLLACLGGCGGGDPRGSVTGTVQLDGRPVDKGMIAFVPVGDTKGPTTGDVIKDGKYQIARERGPVPGKYEVEITATRSLGTIVVPGAAGATGGLSAAGPVEKIETFTPKKKPAVEIKAGPNEHRFDIKSTD